MINSHISKSSSTFLYFEDSTLQNYDYSWKFQNFSLLIFFKAMACSLPQSQQAYFCLSSENNSNISFRIAHSVFLAIFANAVFCKKLGCVACAEYYFSSFREKISLILRNNFALCFFYCNFADKFRNT